MKKIIRFLFAFSCLIFIPVLSLYSQEYNFDDDCCDEYYLEDTTSDMWAQQMSTEQNKVALLLSEIDQINLEIDSIRNLSLAKDKNILDAENELYSSVGSTKRGIDDFRKKFKDCERMIMDCKDAESAELIRKSCFNEIEASRIKCLPEFWERYLIMKKRLEECTDKIEIEEKAGDYTVVKGDCLWKISGKKEIYGNPRLWPKIWDANKNGVISAPSRIPKTIKNPNLIYPGQVLRIPSLSEVEKKMESNKEKEIKKKRKNKNE